MYRQKVVNMGQRGLNPAHQWLVLIRAEQRVEPDQTMATAMEPIHLLPKHVDITSVPAIADDHHHCALAQYPSRPIIVERADGFADARAACPIIDHTGRFIQCLIHVPSLKLASDPSETCAKDKRLDPIQAAADHVDKLEQKIHHHSAS